MTDISKMIQEATQKAMNPENLGPKIEERVNSTIDGILGSMFQMHGDVFKEIKDQLREKIKVDLSNVTIPEYGVMVSDMVVEAAKASMEKSLEEHLLKELNDMFSPAPTECTVQDVADIFLEKWREDRECDCFDEYDDWATVEVEPNKSWFNLKIWKKKRESDRYSISGSIIKDRKPDIHLYISDKGKIRIIWKEGSNIKESNMATTIYSQYATLYQMYAAGTVITDISTVDTDELDLCLEREF